MIECDDLSLEDTPDVSIMLCMVNGFTDYQFQNVPTTHNEKQELK
jgi:hypothetical protein